MIWQRRSRTLGPPQFPLAGCGGNLLACCWDRADTPMEATSSTEQMPMPYAFRKARLTARVSATRISAPCISGETLEGSASPYPTNPLHVLVLNTVALKAQRCAVGSLKERSEEHTSELQSLAYLVC